MTFTKNDLINSIKFYEHLDKKKLYHLFKVYKSLNISDNIVETIIKLKRKKNPYHFIKKLHLKYKVLKDLKGGYFDPNANLNPNSPNLIQPNPNNFETIPLIPQNFSPQPMQPQPIHQCKCNLCRRNLYKCSHRLCNNSQCRYNLCSRNQCKCSNSQYKYSHHN